MASNRNISYKGELQRKGIHLFSILIPIVYSQLTMGQMLSILIPLTLFFIFFDLASKKYKWARDFVFNNFGHMLRPHEYSRGIILNGASWELISACLCVIIFPKVIFLVGFSILIVSDMCAALIGRKYGRHKIFKTKSIEGTTAFILSAWIVILIIGQLLSAPWTFYLFGGIAAFIGGIVEATSHIMKMDDNFSIPFSIGLIMWFGGFAAFYMNVPYLDII